jgi:hypothetical protein
MNNEQLIMRKVAKLPRDEQLRVAEIFNATVLGANALPDPVASRHMLAHTMLDFIIDALVERRKKHEHFQTRGK